MVGQPTASTRVPALSVQWRGEAQRSFDVPPGSRRGSRHYVNCGRLDLLRMPVGRLLSAFEFLNRPKRKQLIRIHRVDNRPECFRSKQNHTENSAGGTKASKDEIEQSLAPSPLVLRNATRLNECNDFHAMPELDCEFCLLPTTCVGQFE